MVFLGCVLVAACGVCFVLGWWLGFTAPLDDRRHVDSLARRDRQ